MVTLMTTLCVLEIAFPINLQLFNTSILSQIKITNPGAGYTSAPSVIISGGGGSGAEAEAVVKNNRLSEILIKNPGAGYSSQPVVTLKSEFTYVVNLDLNYLQFNFPHGITTGAEVQFRADDIGSEVGVLPKLSSVGLTSLSSTQTYYAIAGNVNGLEADQLRFALTRVDAESGNFITFLTQGDGRQVLLTEVFGGEAKQWLRPLDSWKVKNSSKVSLTNLLAPLVLYQKTKVGRFNLRFLKLLTPVVTLLLVVRCRVLSLVHLV